MTRPSPADSAVQQLLDEYRQQLSIKRVQTATGDAPQLAYFGTWQDAVPRDLIVDPILRPADKIVWQVLRTHIGDPRRPVASPGHDDIARAANVSRNTVQAALTALRLQGWIVTFGGQVRSEHATDRGRFRQQTYFLHDRPPTLVERLALGTDYLRFVNDSAFHPSRHIRAIAYGLLDHLRAYTLDGTGPFAEQLTPSVYEMYRDNAADQAVAAGRIRQRIETVEAVASLAVSVPQAGEAADENDGEGEADEGAEETCGEPAEMVTASPEPHPLCAAEAVVNDAARGATLASKCVSFEQRIAEIQHKNTTNPARQNLRTAETAEKPVFEPCAKFAHGLQSSSSCIKDTTTARAHTREDDEPYWLPPDVRALLQASELAMIVSSVETILEGPQAKLRQLVIDEWAGQLRLEAQGLRDPNDPIQRRCSYLRGMALRAARANPGRQGFNLTLVGKAIGDERRRAQSREPEATVPEQIRPTIPARPQPGSPKLPPKAPADPGALRHASEMAAHWQQRVEHTESEKAPKAVRDSARSNLDFWQTEVLRLSARATATRRPGEDSEGVS